MKPADIDYVEAHGTGTSLGDPIEVEALGAVMREGRRPDRPLLIGSIKTNIGHAEAAAGLAGLLKVVMSLRHESIPPHLHFSQPNPGIPWDELPIGVPTALTPWPRGDRPRRAGVSSFGFTGTNAHVVLEEAPLHAVTAAAGSSTPGPRLVTLSASDQAALRQSALRLAEFLGGPAAPSLADVATTLATGRAHLPRRLALLSDSTQDLQQRLLAIAAGDTPPGVLVGNVRPGERQKIGFLFTGQGAQYAGMGRGLYDSEPVVRSVLDRAAAILAPQLERPLLDVMFPADGSSALLSETAYTQPALFALGFALAELWRSWGITPSIVAGHSVGEYVAACVAGVFSFEDGLSLVAERGRLMQALPAGGAMAAVFCAEAHIADHVASRADRLAIAAVNGPEEIVLSGDKLALDDVLAQLTAASIQTRRLEVSHAFHSPRLDPMLDALGLRAKAVVHAPPRISLVSNLTGTVFPAGSGPGASYWARHARGAVRFAAGLEALHAAGVTVLVELGPHPTLLALAGRAVPGGSWTMTGSLRRGHDDRREMLSALAAVHVRGTPVQWGAVSAVTGGRRISLPTYAFQRERHWVGGAAKPARRDLATGHPLLGERRDFANTPGTFVWERELSLNTHRWLVDHRVQGAAIVPATAYIEIALAAGAAVLSRGSLAVHHMENLKPIILHNGDSRLVQTMLVIEDDGNARLSVHSRPFQNERGGAAPWTAHVERPTERRSGAFCRSMRPRHRRRGPRTLPCRDDRHVVLRHPCRQGQPVGPVLPGGAAVVGRAGRSRRAHRGTRGTSGRDRALHLPSGACRCLRSSARGNRPSE